MLVYHNTCFHSQAPAPAAYVLMYSFKQPLSSSNKWLIFVYLYAVLETKKTAHSIFAQFWYLFENRIFAGCFYILSYEYWVEKFVISINIAVTFIVKRSHFTLLLYYLFNLPAQQCSEMGFWMSADGDGAKSIFKEWKWRRHVGVTRIAEKRRGINCCLLAYVFCKPC